MRNFTDITNAAIRPESIFSVSYTNARSISFTLKSLVDGNVSWSGNRGAWSYGSDGAQSIWESRHDLSAWIETVASSITTAIRSNATIADPDGSAKLYAGMATSTRSFVKVRWVWISYPALMLALGIVHFLATVWQAIRLGIYPWKANPIVPLLIEVDNEGDSVTKMDEAGQIPKGLLEGKSELTYCEARGWSMTMNIR